MNSAVISVCILDFKFQAENTGENAFSSFILLVSLPFEASFFLFIYLLELNLYQCVHFQRKCTLALRPQIREKIQSMYAQNC